MVELLSPVQDFVSLQAAIHAGADAVYFGLKEFSMRASAKNFNLNELKKVVEICHKNNVKAYLTLNTIVYEDEIKKIKSVLGNDINCLKMSSFIWLKPYWSSNTNLAMFLFSKTLFKS